ncbi:hypothetical protein [Desulfosarcina sp.]|uniref:hypothetical protein n=1 Tax=Desulfosarcina sp. TaxID=2027861 RepID=UPI0035683AE6
MKKTVFLMLSAMAILFCGCSTGSSYGLLGTADPDLGLINTPTRPTIEVTYQRGVCMPISANSSLNVDVECIIEYVQRDGSFDAFEAQNDSLHPWIHLNYSF